MTTRTAVASARALALGCSLVFLGSASGQTIGVIAPVAESGPWCTLLSSVGYACTELSAAGDPGPLDSFDVVVMIATSWPDAGTALGDVVASGRGVLTWGDAPVALGIFDNPNVRAWIGANDISLGNFLLSTECDDVIAGDIRAGTELLECVFAICPALVDTTGHPDARVIARWDNGAIGVLRNNYAGGRSVYLQQTIAPDGSQFDFGDAELNREIILNAIAWLATDTTGPCATPAACADADACTFDFCGTTSCMHQRTAYGDVNADTLVDLLDVTCVLDAFAGEFSTCTVVNADIAPCAGDNTVDLEDILAVLDAFSGLDPCCCTP